jgi:cellulose synthase (UDP-forming)
VEAWLRTGDVPSVTVLVPAYKEEVRTIEQTLMSAALQDVPDRTVVLLLDDPPVPSDPIDRRRLREVRAVPGRIDGLLDSLRVPLEAERVAFRERARSGATTLATEIVQLARLYRATADRVRGLAASYPRADHTDALFIDGIVLRFAAELSQRADALEDDGLDARAVRQAYDRLAGMFRGRVRCFERKRYLNLSHEPNKAMNLNAYVGLMGQSFVEHGAFGRELLRKIPADSPEGTLHIPDARYVVTLDADSLLVPGYVARLVQVMEQRGNERVAVIQTPYSAVPGAPGVLERIAGATTDIQFLVHQGSSWLSAAYWVGANAVLRKTALDDIAFEGSERGFRVRRFIQDRTAIEDTESTVDLIQRGWSVLNYPRRLAYSATPPDFGSVLIQRRRWANGGLIILPKLLRYLARPFRWAKVGEGFVRIHYLVSLAGVNSALLVMLVVPFEQDLHDPWLMLTAVPYFFLYGRDLSRRGYRFTDLLRVYAFNLMLIPIQLAGVGKSLQQLVTGVRAPFARTPKILGRTSAPRAYVAMEYALTFYLFYATATDMLAAAWLQAAFAFVNGAFLLYATAAFMGWRNSLEDLRPRWPMRVPLEPSGTVRRGLWRRRVDVPGRELLAGAAPFRRARPSATRGKRERARGRDSE